MIQDQEGFQSALKTIRDQKGLGARDLEGASWIAATHPEIAQPLDALRGVSNLIGSVVGTITGVEPQHAPKIISFRTNDGSAHGQAIVPAAHVHNRRELMQHEGSPQLWDNFSLQLGKRRENWFGNGIHFLEVTSTTPAFLSLVKKATRLQATLEERQVTAHITLLGVDHSGHLPLHAAPGMKADLVTLELPVRPVKKYIEQGVNAGLEIKNVFWLGLLDHFREFLPRFGVHGVNSNRNTRAIRQRMYYFDSGLTNDLEEELVRVVLVKGAVSTELSDKLGTTTREKLDQLRRATYSLKALGGDGDTELTASEIYQQLPPQFAAELDQYGIVHLHGAVNPFGSKKHLVVTKAPPEDILFWIDELKARLEPFVERTHFSRAKLSEFIIGHFIEGLLMPQNDAYLVEETFKHIERTSRALVPGSKILVTHIAGAAHLPLLRTLFTHPELQNVEVSTAEDPRFPISGDFMVSKYFSSVAEDILGAVYLHSGAASETKGTPVQHFDHRKVEQIFDQYFDRHSDELERHMLINAIFHRDVVRPCPSAKSLFRGEPGFPSREYVDAYPADLARLIIQSTLSELRTDQLYELNDTLRSFRRSGRGYVPAISQEVREILIRNPEQKAQIEELLAPHLERLYECNFLNADGDPGGTFAALFT